MIDLSEKQGGKVVEQNRTETDRRGMGDRTGAAGSGKGAGNVRGHAEQHQKPRMVRRSALSLSLA